MCEKQPNLMLIQFLLMMWKSYMLSICILYLVDAALHLMDASQRHGPDLTWLLPC